MASATGIGQRRVRLRTDQLLGPRPKPLPVCRQISTVGSADHRFGATVKSALTLFDAGSGTWDSTPLPGYPRSPAATRMRDDAEGPADPADFDGDGVADSRCGVRVTAVASLYSRQRLCGVEARSSRWGRSGDLPVTADIDGDGLTDLAVSRPSTGTWHVLPSGRGFDPQSAVACRWRRGGRTCRSPPTTTATAAPISASGVRRPAPGLSCSRRTGVRPGPRQRSQWGAASRSPSVFDRPVSPTSAVSPDGVYTENCDGHTYRQGDPVYVSCWSVQEKIPRTAQVRAFAATSRLWAGRRRGMLDVSRCGTPPEEFDMSFIIPANTTPGGEDVCGLGP